jgi:hypothetical protein
VKFFVVFYCEISFLVSYLSALLVAGLRFFSIKFTFFILISTTAKRTFWKFYLFEFQNMFFENA